MHPTMNDTKWEEVRLAMSSLGDPPPRWRARDLSGYLSSWDGEWFYHFRAGGYRTIEWVEIEVTSPAKDEAVLAALRAVHVPGERTAQGYRVFGHWYGDRPMHYL